MLARQKNSALIWLWVSILVVILDQCTKCFIRTHLSFEQPYTVLPFLNFILRFNAGAAFSFLANDNGWQTYLLSGIAIVVSLFLIGYLHKLHYKNWLTVLPICLIIGGALGNLIDRLRFGYVVDFIDFHIGAWHFATFNVADMAVSVGAVLLVVRLFYDKKFK